MFALGAALFGAMVLMPLYFQTVRGEDAIATGLLLVARRASARRSRWRSPARFDERHGGGLTSLVGGVITLVATVPFVLIGARHLLLADRGVR